MKKLFKILFILIILAALIFFALYIFVAIKGKGILISRLEEALGRKVEIYDVALRLPFDLKISKLNIEDLLKAEEILASGFIFDFFKKGIILNTLTIVEPRITFIRSKEGKLNLPRIKKAKDSQEPKKEAQKEKGLYFLLRRLLIIDGKFVFLDKKVRPEGLLITVEDIDLNIENFSVLPVSLNTRFKIDARIPWDGSFEGKLESSGWINLSRKDMQAEFAIRNIDGLYLSPYYFRYLNPEHIGAEKVIADFTSNLEAKNNDLTARCRLDIHTLKRHHVPDEERPVSEDLTKSILGIFEKPGGGYLLDFVVKTKLDNPRFGLENIRMAVEKKISKELKPSIIPSAKDIVEFPGKVVEKAIKKGKDLPGAAEEVIKDVGKRLKDALEGLFQIKKEEDNNN